MSELTEAAVTKQLRTVKDPELNLSIVDLGLIYDVEIEGRNVEVKMTLTSPGCPSGPEILGDAEQSVRAMEGVESVKVELVWEPYWSPERIDPRVRSFLGL